MGHDEKRMTLTQWVLASIICILLVFFILSVAIRFKLEDDLILSVAVNQSSFHISNNENATVQLEVTTDRQLWCEATCIVSALQVSTNQTVYNINFTSIDQQVNIFNISMQPVQKGSGQVLYSVAASCRNKQTIFCRSSGVETRKTLLVAVNYDLDIEQSKAKNSARTALESAIADLEQVDLLVSQAEAAIKLMPQLHVDDLQLKIGKLRQEIGARNVFLENLLKLWSDESYVILEQLLSNEEAPPFDDAFILSQELDDLRVLHNSLLSRIQTQQQTIHSIIQSYPTLSHDASPLVETTNSLVQKYTIGNFTTYKELTTLINEQETRIANYLWVLQGRRSAAEQDAGTIIHDLCEYCTLKSVNSTTYTSTSPACDELQELHATLNAALTNGTDTTANATANTTANITNETSIITIQLPPRIHTFNGSTPEINLTIETLNETITAVEEFLSFYCKEYNGTELLTITDQPVVLATPQVNGTIKITIPENHPQCCVFGVCQPCCNTESCKDDASTYPIMLIHGHMVHRWGTPEYSLGGYFSKIQQRLQDDGYLDAGLHTSASQLSDVGPGEWGITGHPISVRVTYYYNFYVVGDVYVRTTQKSESIETYAVRLKEMVDLVKHHTGKEKVILVGYSMGGLVVRRYEQLFGSEDLDRIIVIGTPNNGIVARTSAFCPVLGESTECIDMQKGSVFMQKLNDQKYKPSVPIVTIAGSGCDTSGKDGDGVVQKESVALPFATNYVVNGTCTDFLRTNLHIELLNIDRHPKVYELLRAAITK